jgi:hypothetical protein
MAARQQAQLGAVQETLFITLAARAAESQRRHPVLRDPRAVELLRSVDYDAAKYGQGAGGFVTVLPPGDMRGGLPARYRYLVPLADPLLGKSMDLTLFRASSPAAAGPAGTARAPGAA